MKELKTQRLILKKITKEDMLKIYEYDYTYLRGINGEYKKLKNDESKILSWYDEDSSDLEWGIFKEDLTPIGNIICSTEIDDEYIEISCNLNPDYWKKGYMIESLEVVINYLFTLDYKGIIVNCAHENVFARKLVDKLGFIELPQNNIPNKEIIMIKSILTKERYQTINSNFKR